MEDRFYTNFKDSIGVLNLLEEAGYEAYFVGGCVRDYELDTSFSDIDITTNALPDEVKTIFKKTIDTGLKHGTVTVAFNKEFYEVTTFRTETDYTNHRSPDKVEFVSSLKEDLDRRDFTINALALNSKGVLFDYHSGREDLKNKIIKTVNDPSERFYEDALRMIRAFRFSSKLGFDIEENTLEAIAKNASLIKFVSIERIVNEFRKLLCGIGNEKAMKLLLNSTIHTYIPFLKYIKTYRDFSKYSFCQSLFWLTHFNNINLDELKKLKLSNKEIAKVKTYFKIKDLFENKVNPKLIVYKSGREDVYFVNEVFTYVDKECISNINLPISDFKDIDIEVKKIIEVVGKKPGPWVKEIVAKIEENIVCGDLENNEVVIVDFLQKVKDNI